MSARSVDELREPFGYDADRRLALARSGLTGERRLSSERNTASETCSIAESRALT